MSSTYFVTNLIEKVNYLERKVCSIENGHGLFYDTTSDADIFEYIDCLLLFSQKVKVDLIHKQMYFKSRDKHIVAKIYDKLCDLESRLLYLLPDKEMYYPDSYMRSPCKICSSKCMERSKAYRYNNSPVLGRYDHPLDGSMPTNSSNRNVPFKYFEKLPCKSRKIVIEGSSCHTSDTLILLSDSSTYSSGSDASFENDTYYVKRIPVKSKQVVQKPKRVHYSHRTVPISINKSTNKPSVETTSSNPKVKEYVAVDSKKRQKRKVQRKRRSDSKHKKERKTKFRLEKSPSKHISVNSSQPHAQTDNTQVFFVKKYSGSPWLSNNKSVDFNNEVIYVPYKEGRKRTRGKISSESQKQEMENEPPFVIPVDQNLYYVGVKMSDNKQKESKRPSLTFNGRNNYKTSDGYGFIKSKWTQSTSHTLGNGDGDQNKDIEPTQSREIVNIVLPEINSGKQPEINFGLSEKEVRYINFTEVSNSAPNDENLNVSSLNKDITQQNNISTSVNDRKSGEIYSVVNSHPNGELVLQKLPAESFNMYGDNVNIQSIFVANIPENFPINGNTKRSSNTILQPNTSLSKDRSRLSLLKQSAGNASPDEHNFYIYQADSDRKSRFSEGERKRSGLWSTISRLSGKSKSQIASKRGSNGNLGNGNSKQSATVSKVSRKSANMKNMTEFKPKEDTFSTVEHNMVKNKSNPEKLEKKGKSLSSKQSLKKIVHPNKINESTIEHDPYEKRHASFWKKPLTSEAVKTNKSHFTKGTDRKRSSTVIPRSIPIVVEDLGSRSSIHFYSKGNNGLTEENRTSVYNMQTSGKIENGGRENQPNDGLSYSLHYEKEKRNKLDLCSLPSSLTSIIACECNKVMSHKEVIFSEHKLNGNEYHNKVRKIFTYPSTNNKTALESHTPFTVVGSNSNCKCDRCKHVIFNNRNAHITNNSPLTDSSYSLDWLSIAHKIKQSD